MENFGEYIKNARKKKGISQSELSSILNVSRQSISNWERNSSVPDVMILKDLAEKLDLNYENLVNIISGEMKVKKNKKIIIAIIITLIILMITVFLVIIANRNKFHLYQITSHESNININGGVLALSRNTNFLVIGEIEFPNIDKTLDETDEIKIYQKENNEERLIVKTFYKKNITIQEDYGYNEYFPENLDLENIYMDLRMEDGTITIKLDFKEIISSDKLIYFATDSISSDEDTDYSSYSANQLSNDLLLVNGYSYNEEYNQYSKIDNETSWYYTPTMNDLIMNIDLGDFRVRGLYDVDDSTISLRLLDVPNEEYKTICTYFDNGEVQANVGYCSVANWFCFTFFLFNDTFKSERRVIMKKIILIIFLTFIFTLNVSANTDVRFFKTIKVDNNYFKTIEINEAEYNYYKDNKIELMSNVHTTTYKRIEISSDQTTVSLKVNWLKSPAYKSFDVIALRGEGVEFYDYEIYGKQSYIQNNEKGEIFYSKSSNNTKVFANGVGISMNLVDGASDFELMLEIGFYKTSNSAIIYGSYQHSQRNVTLSQSQNYVLSPNGLGGVIDFSSSVEKYYDGMGGVSISL